MFGGGRKRAYDAMFATTYYRTGTSYHGTAYAYRGSYTACLPVRINYSGQALLSFSVKRVQGSYDVLKES